MRPLLLIVLSLCIVTLNSLLKPRKARRRAAHYDKTAIKANIQKFKSKLSSHTTATQTLTGTDTTATIASSHQLASCNKYYYTQMLDHFGSGIGPNSVTTFQQRYYVCGKDLFNWNLNDPIFFYCGNEADVTSYISYTGFMWENADQFNALLVFAEHRYYGESLPYSQSDIIDDTEKLKYLTTDQALEDYAVLIDHLKQKAFGYSDQYNGANSKLSPIIGFGGSYGGMLAAWLRMKYPHYMDGVIAASSPIFGVWGLIPEADPYAFAAQESYDTSVDVGVNNNLCTENIRFGWNDLMSQSSTQSGRNSLGNLFNLCSTPTADNVYDIMAIIEESISYMAMSSYPYPSNYISGAVLGTTIGSLPAYPLTYGCNKYLTTSFSTTIDRVTALSQFNSIFWNSDGLNTCIDIDNLWNTYNDYIWDYLYCRSLLMPSGFKGGDFDMFWDQEWLSDDTISWCNNEYNIFVDINGPASRRYGARDLYKSMTNIVFSNGNMDPWKPNGVISDELIGGNGNSDGITTIMIENAGHHLDLMFSNDNDNESVIRARKIEVNNIKNWIQQSNDKYNIGMCDSNNINQKSHPFITAINMLM